MLTKPNCQGPTGKGEITKIVLTTRTHGRDWGYGSLAFAPMPLRQRIELRFVFSTKDSFHFWLFPHFHWFNQNILNLREFVFHEPIEFLSSSHLCHFFSLCDALGGVSPFSVPVGLSGFPSDHPAFIHFF